MPGVRAAARNPSPEGNQRHQQTEKRAFEVVRLSRACSSEPSAHPVRNAASAVTAARADAVCPSPIHLDHIEANEMFSNPRRLGAVVSVTVRYQSCSSCRLPDHP